jgi:hypothetical protein
MLNKLYNNIRKHYHLYSFIANLLMAISMAGLTLLGVLNDSFTAAMLMSWGVLFAVMYGVGKLLNQEIEDLDKVGGHTCEVPDRTAK